MFYFWKLSSILLKLCVTYLIITQFSLQIRFLPLISQEWRLLIGNAIILLDAALLLSIVSAGPERQPIKGALASILAMGYGYIGITELQIRGVKSGIGPLEMLAEVVLFAVIFMSIRGLIHWTEKKAKRRMVALEGSGGQLAAST